MNENGLPKSLRRLIPHFAVLAIVGCILTAGLWPFHAPLNEVSWLGSGPGLKFGDFGYIVSMQPFPLAVPAHEHSLEIGLQPDNIWYHSTLLTFYRPNSPVSFTLRQIARGIAIDRNVRTPHSHAQTQMFIPDVFSSPGKALFALVAGANVTRGYVNGQPLRSVANVQLDSDAFAGQLLVGNSAFYNDSWEGRLLGVALYDEALTDAEVQHHYQNWTGQGSPVSETEKNPAALYLFDERKGDIAHSKAQGAPDLLIPRRYAILNQRFLTPVWEEFRAGSGFWKSVLINIGGFIPFGFVVRAYLFPGAASGPPSDKEERHIALLTAGLGFLTSLTIEVLQSFLPTRQSGTTDLITNTLGTAIGCGLYRWCPRSLRVLLSRFEEGL